MESSPLSGADTAIESRQPAWRRHFATFWDLFLIVAFGAGLFDSARTAGLWNPRGIWLILLALAFLTAHRWLWAPARGGTGTWPPLYRDVLLVQIVELVLVIAMLPASAWFAWPLLAMMGQIAAALPPPRWRLPFAAILLVLSGPIGLYHALAARQWGLAAGLAAAAAWLVAIFLYIRLHFDDRETRERIKQDLRDARDEIEQSRPLMQRIDTLHAREASLGDLRASLQHTLAFLNLRLEAVRAQLGEDPASGAAELADLHQLIQQRLADVARWPEPPEPVAEDRTHVDAISAPEQLAEAAMLSSPDQAIPSIPPAPDDQTDLVTNTHGELAVTTVISPALEISEPGPTAAPTEDSQNDRAEADTSAQPPAANDAASPAEPQPLITASTTPPDAESLNNQRDASS